MRYRGYSTEHQINTGSDPLSEILEHRFIGEFRNFEFVRYIYTDIYMLICKYYVTYNTYVRYATPPSLST